MALLVLIALGQLVVSWLLLGAVSQLVERETAQAQAERSIRNIQQQTLHAMFMASDADSVRSRKEQP